MRLASTNSSQSTTRSATMPSAGNRTPIFKGRSMAWSSSNRYKELPNNWALIRRAVLARDSSTCRIAGPDCTGTATEVDHINDKHDHRLTNLQAVCHTCHRHKTLEQSHEWMSRRFRDPEPHPGGGPR